MRIILETAEPYSIQCVKEKQRQRGGCIERRFENGARLFRLLVGESLGTRLSKIEAVVGEDKQRREEG